MMGRLLVCLFLLAMVSALAGQETGSQPRPDGPEDIKALPKETKSPSKSAQAAEFKGQAKVSTHPYKMHKGDAYRIIVKGDGFVPQVRIEGQRGYTPNTTVTSSFLDPKAPLTRREAQVIFFPTATKVYHIQVDYAIGTEIGKGPHTYTLRIERGSFKPVAAFKDSQLTLGDNSKRMEQGKAYRITVTGQGFAPEVQILDGTRSVMTSMSGRWFGFGPDAEYIGTFIFIPPRTTDYRIILGLGPVTEKRSAAPKYTTAIVEVKMELSVRDQLTNKDPVYPGRGGRHKVHAVKLQAGKNYQIDMISTAFDSYLFLEDSTRTVLMQDDDGGGYPNARIIFRPKTTDTYRIVATTFEQATPDRSPGAYSLTVVENPNAQPVFKLPPLDKGFPKFKK
jgi:hypothetical protein